MSSSFFSSLCPFILSYVDIFLKPLDTKSELCDKMVWPLTKAERVTEMTPAERR